MRLLISCSIAALLSGCAAVDTKPDLAPLRATLGDRAGGEIALRNADGPVTQRIEQLRAQPLSMTGAVQLALLASPEMQSHYAEVGIARADMALASSLTNPRVDVSVRPTTNPAALANLEFGIVQSIVDVMTQPVRAKAAAATFEAAKLKVAADVVVAVGEVRRAYVELVAARNLVVAHQGMANAAEAAALLAQKMHAAGNVPDLMLNREQSAFEDAATGVMKAELDVAARAPQLARLLGTESAPLQIPDKLPAPPADNNDGDALAAVAAERRLDVAALRQSLEAARTTLKSKVDWRAWQEIEVGLSAERDGDGQWALGPNISFALPLINRGGPAAARAAAELMKAENDLRAGLGRVQAEVATAMAKVAAARRLVERYRTVILPLKHNIVVQVQQNQNYMLVGVFDALAAKREEGAAQAAYVEALRDYWLARVDLAEAVGGADLDLPADKGASS